MVGACELSCGLSCGLMTIRWDECERHGFFAISPKALVRSRSRLGNWAGVVSRTVYQITRSPKVEKEISRGSSSPQSRHVDP